MGNIIAFVGMPGSGKSEAVAMFEEHGYEIVYFGGLTLEELERRNLKPGEESEKIVREALRKEHGMAAYAILNLPRIRELASNGSGNVVIDGLYSWEEYQLLKGVADLEIVVVAIFAPPALRYSRLENRKDRPLDKEVAASRDESQITNLNTGGPIAMADFTIVNVGTKREFRKNISDLLKMYT